MVKKSFKIKNWLNLSCKVGEIVFCSEIWRDTSDFWLVWPLGCCWLSVLTTKWLSRQGDPIIYIGHLHVANQQQQQKMFGSLLWG